MRTYILLIFFFYSVVYAQKKYHFDKAVFVNYQEIDKNDSLKKANLIYLINSKDNQFLESVHFKKDSAFLQFTDIRSIQVFEPIIDSISFIKSEIVSFDCKFIKNYSNQFYLSKAKKYKYVLHKDTIYNNKTCYHVEIISKNRKKSNSLNIIVEKDDNQIPFINSNWNLMVNIWDLTKIPIKGKTLCTYYKSYDNKISKKSTFEYVEIEKYIVIPKECDNLNKCFNR